jgi:integrase
VPARNSAKPPKSCADCLAWGVLERRRCPACSVFRHRHPGEQRCAGCGLVLAVKNGYCRLCWCQAAAESKAAGGLPHGAISALEMHPAGLAYHQLFFHSLKLRRSGSPDSGPGGRGGPTRTSPRPASRPPAGHVQLRLFEARRDLTRFDERRDADLTSPWLAWALFLAHRLGEARGWSSRVRFGVPRGLIIALSQHAEGDTVLHSEIFTAFRALDIPVGRVAEVLTEMGVFTDDRRLAFDNWLDRKLSGLAPAIRRDTESWLRALRGGGPRRRPRDQATAWNYLNVVLPVLLDWSARHDHLREITRDDVAASLGSLHGSRRLNTLVALRSLFAYGKRTGLIFRDPARRIKGGRREHQLVQPLQPGQVRQAITAATRPADRLIIALAAVHAARPAAIRDLQLHDIDLGNRRLTVAGHTRPLDELTRQAILSWLGYRQARWPGTANPHLLVNQRTALDTRPPSKHWIKAAFRGLDATLERLRVDRQLEEALTHRADPLHLAEVFGLDPTTAIRYAENARQLLVAAAEEQDPAGARGDA